MMMAGYFMGGYFMWIFFILSVLILGWAFYLIGRASAGGNRETENNINDRLMEQTQRLVETISRAREENRLSIGEGLDATRKKLDESLTQGRQELSVTLEKTQKLLTERLENLLRETAEIKGASSRMLEIGADIRSLSQILDGPKGRGGFGEFQLELMLKQAIPADRFRIQYEVEPGKVADAAILFKDAVLCIDSKFPSSNLRKYYEMTEPSPEKEKLLSLFHSDVKNRGKEISKKYIIPPKTLGFAVMFVPAESVFLEIIGDADLHRSLMEMRVVPASPNFLYVYFQALAIGFAGMAVEERAKEMIGVFSELKVNFEKLSDHQATLGRHLKDASNSFERSEKQMGRIGQNLENLRLGEPGPAPKEPDA